MRVVSWVFVGHVLVSTAVAIWAWNSGAMPPGHLTLSSRTSGGALWVVFPAVVTSLALGALTFRRIGLPGGAIGFAVGASITTLAELASVARVI